MKQMDLDAAIDILETYMDKASGKADYLKDVIKELKYVYDEMEKYGRETANLTTIPFDVDRD